MDTKLLTQRLGYDFKNKALLLEALTHPSYSANQHPALKNYQRLEFLGDAVLQLTVTEHIFNNHPTMDEGRMTRLRASIVCQSALFDMANDIGLGDFLLLSRGEELSNGRSKPAILSDVMEAIFGAVYIDGGFEAAKKLINRLVGYHIETASPEDITDYKTTLQEYIQKRFKNAEIRYSVVSERGPDHDKIFCIEVAVDGRIMGSGFGRSKQQAGQMAAKQALDKLL